LNPKRLQKDRRKWPRLPLAIPVFIRTRDDNGKDLLEFGTALNVSAGGALLAVRRSLPVPTQVSLEIPCAPIPDGGSAPQVSRMLAAEATRIVHAAGYHLVGVKFSRPLVSPERQKRFSNPRKVTSPV
jgi:hypothetical protein